MKSSWDEVKHELMNVVYVIVVLGGDLAAAGILRGARYFFPGDEYAAHFHELDALLGGIAVAALFVGLACPLILGFLEAAERIIQKIIDIKKRLPS